MARGGVREFQIGGSEMSESQDAGAAALDTFPKLLAENARRRPDRPAAREKDLGIWQTWTWSQVAEEVRALACGLAVLGLKRGDKIAIVGDNRPRLYWTMTAAQVLGAVPVPLYQDSVATEMAFVLDHAEVRFAMVEDQEQVDKLLGVRADNPRIEQIVYDNDRGLRHYDQDFLHAFEDVQPRNTTVPDHLIGHWKTSDSEYADRSFEITKDSVIIRAGQKTLSNRLISNIETTSGKNINFNTFYLNQEGEEYKFSFYYDSKNNGEIRLKNPVNIEWTKVRQ